MRAFVTGGAGFIGSAFVDRLLADGHDVTAYDNFRTGQRAFLADAARHPRFRLVEADILDAPRLRAASARSVSWLVSGWPGQRLRHAPATQEPSSPDGQLDLLDVAPAGLLERAGHRLGLAPGVHRPAPQAVLARG